MSPTCVAGENKLRISEGGGIARVLAAMREHPSDREVQQKAMGVLFNLAVIRACPASQPTRAHPHLAVACAWWCVGMPGV